MEALSRLCHKEGSPSRAQRTYWVEETEVRKTTKSRHIAVQNGNAKGQPHGIMVEFSVLLFGSPGSRVWISGADLHHLSAVLWWTHMQSRGRLAQMLAQGISSSPPPPQNDNTKHPIEKILDMRTNRKMWTMAGAKSVIGNKIIVNFLSTIMGQKITFLKCWKAKHALTRRKQKCC